MAESDTRIGDVRAYLDAYARQHPEYAAWQAKHWIGDVDGHKCACGCLTANNDVRRLCPACNAIYPLTEAPPVYRQLTLLEATA